MATSLTENICFLLHVFILLVPFGLGRDHRIQLKDEERQTIELSKFGFLQNGILRVNFSDMVVQYNNGKKNGVLFGFSLEKTGSDGISPYMEQHSENCILKDQSFNNINQISLAVIKFDLTKEHIMITKFGKDFLNLTIDNRPALPVLATTATVSSSTGEITSKVPASHSATPSTPMLSSSPNASRSIPVTSSSSSASEISSNLTSPSSKQTISASVPTFAVVGNTSTTANSEVNKSSKIDPTPKVKTSEVRTRRRRKANTHPMTLAKREDKSLPLYSEKTNITAIKYSGNFVVKVKSKAEEGLYNLYFHNCPIRNALGEARVTIQIHIVEKNGNSYLSAGEEPLPYMFGILSVLFFGTAIYWLHILRKNREFTYKVHYMMFTLVLLKSLDLMFQAVNFHFISKDGTPEESWEVLYYITHLLKGALLFTTIVLIGTGYFFIKHVLSDRDKKVFLIVIPLQILANTAQIVMESTEEANTQYATWKELFILVDLLCCGAILFPVVWSIRHLQEGSQTDGKAALNLAKLKLFRHFYVMIVCYIYFTRIIVYLIKITVPFQYMWLDDFFNNAASYVFFVLTGYKFRPAPDNPYLHVPQGDSDDEMEMEEVVTNAGITDGVTRLQPSSNGKRIFETA